MFCRHPRQVDHTHCQRWPLDEVVKALGPVPPDGSFVVLLNSAMVDFGDEDETGQLLLEALMNQAAARRDAGVVPDLDEAAVHVPIVVCVDGPIDEALDIVSEEQMNAHGWYRAPTDRLPRAME